MNMFKTTRVTSMKEYIASLEPTRREIVVALQKIIQDEVPQLKPNFLYNMPGYGSFQYVNYKKEEVAWPIIAIASQKQYVSVYVCAVKGKEYLAEKYEKYLGNVSVGKSCIRLKKLEDLNISVFRKLIVEAAKSPGL